MQLSHFNQINFAALPGYISHLKSPVSLEKIDDQRLEQAQKGFTELVDELSDSRKKRSAQLLGDLRSLLCVGAPAVLIPKEPTSRPIHYGVSTPRSLVPEELARQYVTLPDDRHREVMVALLIHIIKMSSNFRDYIHNKERIDLFRDATSRQINLNQLLYFNRPPAPVDHYLKKARQPLMGKADPIQEPERCGRTAQIVLPNGHSLVALHEFDRCHHYNLTVPPNEVKYEMSVASGIDGNGCPTGTDSDFLRRVCNLASVECSGRLSGTEHELRILLGTPANETGPELGIFFEATAYEINAVLGVMKKLKPVVADPEAAIERARERAAKQGIKGFQVLTD